MPQCPAELGWEAESGTGREDVPVVPTGCQGNSSLSAIAFSTRVCAGFFRLGGASFHEVGRSVSVQRPEGLP